MRTSTPLFALVSLVAASAVAAACYAPKHDDPAAAAAPPAGASFASCDPAKGNAGPRVLRRLTRFEYDNTVRDLLHVAPKYGATFPPDDVVNGFDDDAAALHVAPIYTEKARAAAEEIAGAIALDGLVPCAPATGDAACAAKLVSSFGARAFRRPVTDAEAQRYAALYAAIAATEGFAGGVRAVLTAMLQSPSFLYRTEIGEPAPDGSWRLTPWEIASELSYLFTASMPDDALFAAAARGDLATREGIEAEAKRLFHSDAGRAALEHFVTQWLELDRLALAVKDDRAYPSFTPALRADMLRETIDFFTSTMLQSGATLPALFAGKTTYATDALAKLYGLGAPLAPPDARGVAPYALGPDRAGFLTHASILATQAKPDRPSPVQRGKLVRERLLCQALPPPPPGVNTQLPPVDPNVPNRERFREHSKNGACSTCHRLMDPIGFGFEGFDAIGRAIPNVDTSGEIVGTSATDGPFDGVASLAKILAASPDAQACFALQWYRFAYGVDEAKDPSCGAPKIAQEFAASGASLESLVLSLTRSERFVKRIGDDAAPAAPRDADAAADAAPPAPPPSPTPPSDDASAPPPAITVDVHEDSSWPTGRCDTVHVTSVASAPVDWAARIPASGAITQVWNATQSTDGADWVFVGIDFNRTLPPGGATSFGFCASK